MKKIILTLLVVVLAACGAQPVQAAYVAPGTHYATICLDANNVHVDDFNCAIGDSGDLVGGYGWGYAPYPRTGYFDVPYVGYPVNTHVFVHQVPPVSALNFDRGSFATAPAAGQRGNAQRISVNAGAPVRGSSSVQRGGLGVQQSVEDDNVASSRPVVLKKTTPPAKRTIVSRKKR